VQLVIPELDSFSLRPIKCRRHGLPEAFFIDAHCRFSLT
jgi:hypothetical protein